MERGVVGRRRDREGEGRKDGRRSNREIERGGDGWKRDTNIYYVYPTHSQSHEQYRVQWSTQRMNNIMISLLDLNKHCILTINILHKHLR